jgi:hypothetical protein
MTSDADWERQAHKLMTPYMHSSDVRHTEHFKPYLLLYIFPSEPQSSVTTVGHIIESLFLQKTFWKAITSGLRVVVGGEVG